MRSLFPLVALMLAACGFRPLHQAASPGLSAGNGPLSSIVVETQSADDSDDKRAAFLIQQALRERLDVGDGKYRLLVTPSVSRGGLGVGSNDVASRYDYNIYTAYRLVDAATGKNVKTGQVYAVATFGAPRDPYGRISAEISAADQAAQQVADRILTDLAVHFAEAPPAP